MANPNLPSDSNNPTMDDEMSEIEKQFLSGLPSKCFLTKELLDYAVDNIDEVVNHTIYHELNKKYQVKRSLQLSFLKTLINTAESRCVEINSDIYETYLRLSYSKNQPDFHYVHYYVDHKHISIKEKSSLISNGTTGLLVWQAGKILAEYCSNNRTKFANKRIIELGSGLGFTGISTIMNCHPQTYCFTDVSENVLEYLVENIKINFGNHLRIDEGLTESDELLNAKYEKCNLSVLNLAWEDTFSKYVDDVKPDFILAADVTYDPLSFPAFCSCLTRLLRLNTVCETILSCTVRSEETLKLFFDCLHKHGFRENLIAEHETWNSSYNQKCQVQIFSVLPSEACPSIVELCASYYYSPICAYLKKVRLKRKYFRCSRS